MSGHVDRAGGGGTRGGTSQVKLTTRVHLLPPPPPSPYPSPSSKKPKDQPHAFLLPTRPLAASSEQARLCLVTSVGLRQACLPWICVLSWRQQWGRWCGRECKFWVRRPPSPHCKLTITTLQVDLTRSLSSPRGLLLGKTPNSSHRILLLPPL